MSHKNPPAKVLDKEGNDTGKAMSISDIHKDPELLCETAHVWMYDSSGLILLQQRSIDDSSNPGLWDVSVAGHVDYGEEAEEAAVREIEEEIGLGIGVKELEFMKRNYKETLQTLKNSIHPQFVNIYLLKINKTSTKIKLEDGEVDAVQWKKIEDFEREVHDKKLSKEYVPHDISYYEFIIKEIKKKFQ